MTDSRFTHKRYLRYRRHLIALIKASDQVIANWSTTKLAGSVNELEQAAIKAKDMLRG